jgi:peptidoglycan/LPS O-acetylase OafA/YrhL
VTENASPSLHSSRPLRSPHAGRPRPAALAAAAVIDAALIVLFVAIGRRSHDEGSALAGFLITLWPFLAGAAAGWLAGRAWRAPARIVWSGILIWLGALVVGMLLRVASGQGVQWSFVIVTALVLGVFLLGWRALALVFRRVRMRRHPRPVSASAE